MPKIRLNGVEAALDHTIKNDDVIEVTQGEDGNPAELSIYDLVDSMPRKKVRINNIPYTIEAVITHNGSVVSENEVIEDHDEITCFIPETIEEPIASITVN